MMESKPILLFYASALFEHFFSKNTSRSGIFFVTYEILKELHKQNRFKIILGLSGELINKKSLLLFKKDSFFSQFEYMTLSYSNDLLFKARVAMHWGNLKRDKNIIRKFMSFLAIAKNIFLIIKLGILAKLERNLQENLKGIDLFLSTMNISMPKEILKNTNIKCFHVLYDCIPYILKDYQPFAFYFFDMCKKLDKQTYYFCISESTKKDFLGKFNKKLDENKMMVTHIATNQNYIPSYNKQELIQVLKKYKVEYSNKYLFSLCSLEPRKNLPFTIACFLKFIKKHKIKDLCFYLGGASWYSFTSIIKQALNEAGNYASKIVLLGYVSDKDVNILYSNSLFFTYLSQYEGFGMPPLEAMQAGTPVIASNNSSLPEVIGDAAISVTYNDEDAVIKAFEDFYFNEDLRKEYIARGLERAKMFSWKKTVDKMTEVMENSLK